MVLYILLIGCTGWIEEAYSMQSHVTHCFPLFFLLFYDENEIVA